MDRQTDGQSPQEGSTSRPLPLLLLAACGLMGLLTGCMGKDEVGLCTYTGGCMESDCDGDDCDEAPAPAHHHHHAGTAEAPAEDSAH